MTQTIAPVYASPKWNARGECPPFVQPVGETIGVVGLGADAVEEH
jgi:hypothetical protein